MKKVYKTCEVTQNHINNGTPGDSSCCAIALAMLDVESVGDGDSKICVNGDGIYFYKLKKDSEAGWDSETLYHISMDNWHDVNEFIAEYDKEDEEGLLGKDKIKPFEFKYFIGD